MAYKYNPLIGIGLDDTGNDAAATPGGSDTQVQFNNAGSLAGSADLTWDDSGKELGIGGDISLDDGGTYTTTLQTVTATANRTISFPDATGTVALVAGSSGQVTYNSSGAQAGDANLTWSTTTGLALGKPLSVSAAGAASAPPGTFTGTWFTGGDATTTKPQVLIEPTGTTSTAWSTSGTGLGVNAASGFTGNLYDLQLNGTSKYAFGVGALTFGDAVDLAFNTTTGTKIGTATTQKLAFWNAAPVVQPAAVPDITTTATSGSLPTPDGSVTIADATTPTVAELLEYCVELEAKLEAALGHLRTLGLIAT